MTATFNSDESVTFTELPAARTHRHRAVTDGATIHHVEGHTDTDEVTITGDTAINLVLTADGDGGTLDERGDIHPTPSQPGR